MTKEISINNITINAHSSIKIIGKKTIYFDPFKIVEEVHDADIVFVTHSHYDHYSPEDIKKVSNEDTIIVVPESILSKVTENNIAPVKPNTEISILGLKVEVIPSYNTNKPNHLKEYAWVGYNVKMDGIKYYVCGDMDDTPEGRNVKSDITLVPVGGTYTLNAIEAAEFIDAQKPKIAIPTHYGCIVGKMEDGDTFAKSVSPSIKVVKIIK